MKRKRLLAWLVVVCLLVGMIPQIALAAGENHVAGDGDVPLKLEFLGVDTDNSGPKPAAQTVPEEGLKAGDVIWLGISVEGLTKEKMPALDGYGIFAMTFGVNYDSKYLEAYTDYNHSTGAAVTQDRFRAAAFRGNVSTYTIGTEAASGDLWGAKDAGGGTLYTIDDSSAYGLGLASNTETSALDAATAKLLKIVITGGSGVYNEDLKLYDSTNTGKVILAKFPMKVIDDTANGKDVIELALGGQVFSYTIVESDTNTVVSANCGAWTVEDSNNNLRKVFDYQGAPKLFPAGVVALDGITVTVSGTPEKVPTLAQGNNASGTATAAASPEGATLPSDIAWSIKDNPAGISIAADGKITITPAAAAGTYTVVATSAKASKSGEGNFTLTKDAAVATSMTLSKTTLNDVKVPQVGAATADYTVTPTVNDQYGAKMTNPSVTINTLEGITYDGTKIKVSDAVTTGDKTVTFTVAGTSVTADLTFKVVKGDGKAIPAGTITSSNPTAAGNDGSITGVTADMEVNTKADFTGMAITTFTGMTDGTYYVRYKATEKYNAGAYTTVTLTAPGKSATPDVTVEASSTTPAEGAEVTLTANVTSDKTALVYQWTKDGEDITGATNATYVIASMSAADNGLYNVKVKNTEAGKAQSNEGTAATGVTLTMKTKTVVTVALKTSVTGFNTGAVSAVKASDLMETITPAAGKTLVDNNATVKFYEKTAEAVEEVTGVACTCSKKDETPVPETGHDEGCPYVKAVAAAAAVYEEVTTLAAGKTYYATVGIAAAEDDDYKVSAIAIKGVPTDATVGDYISVTTKSGSTGGGGGGSSSLTVRFDVGTNGTLKGNATVKVNKGSKLTTVPTVTAKDGYSFVGWSLNGKRVDPTTVTINESVTFVAVYSSGEHKTFMEGYEDGSFMPDAGIKRGEAAALLVRLLDDYAEDTAYAATLNDVAGKWYANYVNYASGKGLINGYEDGTFLGESNITRQEFCAIVARYLALENSGAASFADVANVWGEGYIAQLAEKGIVDGYEDGNFRPNGYITRAEVVKILNAVFDRTPNAESVEANIGNYTVRMPDVPKTHWAYYEILEAVVGHEHADFH